ncbi:hypothetical protein M1Y69_003561 [Salmonella enterica]|uniref:ParB/Sulfiredoxin domain-containing protein n=1 Tax=Escherichia phage ECML-4 TaxID=1204523 RepID=I7B6I1_9CAUD|nr:hypothetical protein PI33_gp135 [Escherichia phage ECML-4]EJD3358077.1 hypothetical protein [Salmonella enterica]QMV34227.1 hypothetical protein [Salmonella phage vB_SentM_sal1]QPI14444.1 hypothetical protein GECvBGOT_gp109c [Salmonella phage GEC_vB_GOT]QPI15322.1 hypothetical protein GECvBN6_gp119c [Salmonella phage GEC_vB_N6]WDR21398.1 hypothetical protein PJM36_0113 [Salmonella phage vB_SenM_UTK0005]WDS51134.1 DNA-binding protein [Salmonella phage SeF3a]
MFLTSFIDWMNIINGLRIPVGNLGLSRSSMPQIDTDKQEDFHKYLEDNGVSIDAAQVPIKMLRLTQNEINKMKVWKIMKQIRNKKPMGRVWVSSDNYVVDGSHRFVAALNMDGKQRMKVYKVDLPAMEFVKLAKQFHGVRYRTVSDTRF